jgi:hypothetical protein
MMNVIILLILVVIGFTFHLRPSIVYANSDSVSIPLATNEIKNIDGNIDSNEWKDAHKISFSEARLDGQNVTVYLKYESNNTALDIGFIIPGKSPIPFQSASYEGIHFAFDITDSKSQYLNSNDHLISLYRDKTVQYLIGHKEKGWITNATTATTSETNLPLQEPFSKIDFSITSAINSWSGEFKVYFKSEPTLYRFSILEETNVTSRTGHQIHQTINFPQSSKLTNPSTWTDIKFEKTPGPLPRSLVDKTVNETSSVDETKPELFITNIRAEDLTVTVSGDAISKSGGQIKNYHIDWNDAKTNDLKNFPFVHQYDKPGTYIISIKVEDTNGQTTAWDRSVTLQASNIDLISRIFEPSIMAAIITTIGGIIGVIITVRAKSTSKRRRNSSS